MTRQTSITASDHENPSVSPKGSLARLEGAGVFRAGRWLVRGVGLEIAPGEIVTLIGPNGAGKTTTAKTAIGVIEPDEGTAWLKPGLKIGYVPQKLSIDHTLPLSVARFMRLTAPLKPGRIEAALRRTGVNHLAGAQLATLSGGEMQRVGLARAIAREPDLLVLDEPTAGVDLGGEVSLYELIRSIRDEIGCAILLVSHDLHLVMAATDRVICLNGHVCCSGTPKTVAATPEYRRLFGERAASALALYEHDHDHIHQPDGEISYGDGTNPHACGHRHAHDLEGESGHAGNDPAERDHA